MAAPTPVTNSKQAGHEGWTVFQATWASTDNFADVAVIDLSALANTYTNGVKIKRGFIASSPGISVTLEFDDDSADELIVHHPLGATAPTVFDFTQNIDGGIDYQGSGGTGDVVVTTASAASADDVMIYLEWRAD